MPQVLPLEVQMEGLTKKILRDVGDALLEEATRNLSKPIPWGPFPLFQSLERGRMVKRRRPMTIWDTGILAGSGKAEMSGNVMKVSFSARHASDVEFGSEPKEVAYEDIMRWVKRKLGLKGKDASRAAFFIQRSIRVHGIPPHSFLRRAMQDILIQKKR